MREKPPISDETLISLLDDNYDIDVSTLQFMPVGNDATASLYQVNDSHLLKVKRGVFKPASVQIPYHLYSQGIVQVVAPILTKDDQLWVKHGEFWLIMYPFIDGQLGSDIGLTDDQWITFGNALKRIHEAVVPVDIDVPKETFAPKWAKIAKQIHAAIPNTIYDDPYEKALAEFWSSRYTEIAALIETTERIGQAIQQRSPDDVLCHADIHKANMLITDDGALHIVDWDEIILAPKERDLWFVDFDTPFYEGYGQVEPNKLVLAYYAYEWVVQEIGDFGERVFLSPDTGDITKHESVEEFKALFASGNVVEWARSHDIGAIDGNRG